MQAKATGLPLFLLFCLLVVGLGAERRHAAAQTTGPERIVVSDVELFGRVSIPVGLLVDGTEIGGLSALTYDPVGDVYYVLSDDRSERDPARYYTVSIDLSSGSLTTGDVTFEDATLLRQPDDQTFPSGGIDPEGIAYSPGGTLFIASEGAPLNLTPVPPFVNEFSLNGRQVRPFAVPGRFLPDGSGTVGIRNNLSFESLTLEPGARYAFAAVENALAQDGPTADAGITSLSRVLRFDRISGTTDQELVYPVGPALAPVTADIPHGLVEIAALDENGTFLTLERGPSPGFGLAVLLYQTQLQGALNVHEIDDLVWDDSGSVYNIDGLATKELLLDFSALGLPFINNFEGMTLGPVLPDGRQSLVLVSDNNFSLVPTEIIVLALTLETVPAAAPSLETPPILDDVAAAGASAGQSSDAAIWLHPEDKSQSLVALALGDGGLVTLDLDGEVIQQITPPNYGDVRFNGVDVVYDFSLGAETADLLVVTDGQSDSLLVFRMDPDTRELVDITSASMPDTLFGEDDGLHTARHLTLYTSPRKGTVYAFASQNEGNLVTQVQLLAGGDGLVFGEIVRTLELPDPLGDPLLAAATGLVADRFRATLYVGQAEGQGIVKFDAEPDGGNDNTVFASRSDADAPEGVGGLALYYGPGHTGYLLASDPEDQSYAVFRRSDDAYIGSFIVPENGAVDQANRSTGIDLTSASLGEAYPNGLFIVQDSADDPQTLSAEDDSLRNISSNFKLVGWDIIASAFAEALTIDPFTYNPRAPMRILLPMLAGE